MMKRTNTGVAHPMWKLGRITKCLFIRSAHTGHTHRYFNHYSVEHLSFRIVPGCS